MAFLNLVQTVKDKQEGGENREIINWTAFNMWKSEAGKKVEKSSKMII